MHPFVIAFNATIADAVQRLADCGVSLRGGGASATPVGKALQARVTRRR
jgi:hypothetical protein